MRFVYFGDLSNGFVSHDCGCVFDPSGSTGTDGSISAFRSLSMSPAMGDRLEVRVLWNDSFVDLDVPGRRCGGLSGEFFWSALACVHLRYSSFWFFRKNIQSEADAGASDRARGDDHLRGGEKRRLNQKNESRLVPSEKKIEVSPPKSLRVPFCS